MLVDYISLIPKYDWAVTTKKRSQNKVRNECIFVLFIELLQKLNLFLEQSKIPGIVLCFAFFSFFFYVTKLKC